MKDFGFVVLKNGGILEEGMKKNCKSEEKIKG